MTDNYQTVTNQLQIKYLIMDLKQLHCVPMQVFKVLSSTYVLS